MPFSAQLGRSCIRYVLNILCWRTFTGAAIRERKKKERGRLQFILYMEAAPHAVASSKLLMQHRSPIHVIDKIKWTSLLFLFFIKKIS